MSITQYTVYTKNKKYVFGSERYCFFLPAGTIMTTVSLVCRICTIPASTTQMMMMNDVTSSLVLPFIRVECWTLSTKVSICAEWMYPPLPLLVHHLYYVRHLSIGRQIGHHIDQWRGERVHCIDQSLLDMNNDILSHVLLKYELVHTWCFTRDQCYIWCYRFSVVVPLINCGTSLYAGFVIFSVLGYMAKQAGVRVEDIVDSGESINYIQLWGWISLSPSDSCPTQRPLAGEGGYILPTWMLAKLQITVTRCIFIFLSICFLQSIYCCVLNLLWNYNYEHSLVMTTQLLIITRIGQYCRELGTISLLYWLHIIVHQKDYMQLGSSFCTPIW